MGSSKLGEKVLWVDTETTGLDPDINGIVQIAGIVEVGGVEKESFSLQVRPFPDQIIDPKALEVNGLTTGEIAGFPEPRTVRSTLTSIFNKYVDPYDPLDKFVFTGYNSPFDADFMREFFAKCGGTPYFGAYIHWPTVDIAMLASLKLNKVRGEIGRFSLVNVAKYLGIEPGGNAHDALVDIRMTKDVFEKLYGG